MKSKGNKIKIAVLMIIGILSLSTGMTAFAADAETVLRDALSAAAETGSATITITGDSGLSVTFHIPDGTEITINTGAEGGGADIEVGGAESSEESGKDVGTQPDSQEIEDDDVPLAALPKVGEDNTSLYLTVLFGISLLGISFVYIQGSDHKSREKPLKISETD